MRALKIDLVYGVCDDKVRANMIDMGQYQYNHSETFPVKLHLTWAANLDQEIKN